MSPTDAIAVVVIALVLVVVIAFGTGAIIHWLLGGYDE